MAMHRKNSSKGAPREGDGEQQWFKNNRQRARNRRDIAKASKRKNRGKK